MDLQMGKEVVLSALGVNGRLNLSAFVYIASIVNNWNVTSPEKSLHVPSIRPSK